MEKIWKIFFSDTGIKISESSWQRAKKKEKKNCRFWVKITSFYIEILNTHGPDFFNIFSTLVSLLEGQKKIFVSTSSQTPLFLPDLLKGRKAACGHNRPKGRFQTV